MDRFDQEFIESNHSKKRPNMGYVGLIVVGVICFSTSFWSRCNSSTKSSIATIPHARQLQQEDEGKSLIYSKIATIVPDDSHHVPVDDATRKEIADQWGKWHFWDGEESNRPTGDYCGKYKNRDIPGDQFPDNAWQADAVFVNHIINDAEELIARAQEAIYTEYGHGKPLPAEGLAERRKMFRWERYDLKNLETEPKKYAWKGDHGGGGWTTERSFDGLVRRLLHAIMTSDTFTVVLGGHSAAAGHGNHFHQSYMMQFHKVMAPIFARLGVKLVTRNMAQGGLGTIQAAMGSGSIYGDDVDVLLWDSAMTETNPAHIDLFLRQALLAGKRVPVVWGGDFYILRALHEHADVDVGVFGRGTDGIPVITSVEQAKTIPWAARYMKCSREADYICQAQSRFCAYCWIDRDDINPNKLFDYIKEKPGSQVRWHPGWREHLLTGRVLAMGMLDALQAAIQIWSDGTMGGPPLDDDEWHVSSYYENIRNKVMNLDPSRGRCYDIQNQLPKRMCNTPMQARTYFTPRANPLETSISAIIKPAPDGTIPQNKAKVMYDVPDVYNKCYDTPAGEVDVIAVVSGRRHLEESQLIDVKLPTQSIHFAASNTSRYLAADDQIVTGLGWQVIDEKPGYCDGSYNVVCGRNRKDDCPLLGHHDGRGAIVGNEYSGWLVMDLPNLKEGIIVLKIISWYPTNVNTITETWKSVNNKGETASRRLESEHTEPRRLMLKDFPDSFRFEFAINGKVTSWTKRELIEKKQDVQRVVETVTLLDDSKFTSEATNVELGIRIVGCGRDCVIGVTHVYWA